MKVSDIKEGDEIYISAFISGGYLLCKVLKILKTKVNIIFLEEKRKVSYTYEEIERYSLSKSQYIEHSKREHALSKLKALMNLNVIKMPSQDIYDILEYVEKKGKK